MRVDPQARAYSFGLEKSTIPSHAILSTLVAIPAPGRRRQMTIATMVLSAFMITLSTGSILPVSPQREVAAEVERQKRARQGARNDLDHAGAQWVVTELLR